MSHDAARRQSFPGILLAAILLAASAAGLSAQTVPAVDPALQARLTAILSRFPAESGPVRDRASADLLALGEPGLQLACRSLVATGSADDSLVRYALHGAAVYAARAGAGAERTALASALAKALAAHPDVEAKAFLLSQLQLAGRDESVPAIAACLAQPGLADPASRALAAIGGVAAE